MTIPQDAIEAAAQALGDSVMDDQPTSWASDLPDWSCVDDEAFHIDFDSVGSVDVSQAVDIALTAALPALEQQIREYIAREIEAKAPLAYYPHESGYEKYQGMKYAAQIARGKDKS